MAYVLPTLVAMGFGYAICELALKRPLVGLELGLGRLLAGDRGHGRGRDSDGRRLGLGALHVLSADDREPALLHRRGAGRGGIVDLGRADGGEPAPPGSKENPGATMPLAMFGNVAGAYLWAWTSVGAALEILVLILPVALGFKDTIDAGLARIFFSWTLHAIVYFWLMPTYIAFYTIVPRAIGGRLYSDTMGRVAFVLFLVFSMPIGMHHLFADPQVGSGFKFVHAVMTAMVSVPTLHDRVHDRGLGGDRGAASRRQGPLRLGEGAALGQPGDARGHPLVRDAGVRRRRRAHQHELPAERDGAQHAVGHGPLPPDLRRRHRDHVLHRRLRAVAAAHELRAAQRAGDARAALDVVRGHDGPHPAVALGGHPRHAAAHGVLRLHEPGDAGAGVDGHGVRHRRRDPGRVRADVRLHPRARAPRRGRRPPRSPSASPRIRATRRRCSTASACGSG